MKFTEIKKWAASCGYDLSRKKQEDKTYLYTWTHGEGGGTATSTFDSAKAIYNHITNDKWVEYQENYVPPQKEEKWSYL